MNRQNNIEYYRVRATTSRELARSASDPQIAKIHWDFARHYEAAMARDEPHLRIVSD